MKFQKSSKKGNILVISPRIPLADLFPDSPFKKKLLTEDPNFSNLIHIKKGLINNSWKWNKFLIQELNQDVFKNVNIVNKNYSKLQNHLEGKNGIRVPKLLTQKGAWRTFEYIPSETFLKPKNENMAFKTAFAFGKFQEAFLDMPLGEIEETIPNFHNVESRILQLENAVKTNKAYRKEKIQQEIEKVLKEKSFWLMLSEQMKNCQKRIVHYDTKISNVLFSKDDSVKAIIDLDTTMPGFTFFDYGDMIRSMCSKSKEDVRDARKVQVDTNLFEAITEGYLAATNEWITPFEKSNLMNGVMYIIFENATRFLTDYINGDIYFRTSRKNQNLDRFKSQHKLYKEFKRNFQKYEKIIFSI